MTRILLLGLDPETVDYSDPALPPGMVSPYSDLNSVTGSIRAARIAGK